MDKLKEQLKKALQAGDAKLAEKIKKKIEESRKEQFKKEIIKSQVMGVRG